MPRPAMPQDSIRRPTSSANRRGVARSSRRQRNGAPSRKVNSPSRSCSATGRATGRRRAAIGPPTNPANRARGRRSVIQNLARVASRSLPRPLPQLPPPRRRNSLGRSPRGPDSGAWGKLAKSAAAPPAPSFSQSPPLSEALLKGFARPRRVRLSELPVARGARSTGP